MQYSGALFLINSINVCEYFSAFLALYTKCLKHMTMYIVFNMTCFVICALEHLKNTNEPYKASIWKKKNIRNWVDLRQAAVFTVVEGNKCLCLTLVLICCGYVEAVTLFHSQRHWGAVRRTAAAERGGGGSERGWRGRESFLLIWNSSKPPSPTFTVIAAFWTLINTQLQILRMRNTFCIAFFRTTWPVSKVRDCRHYIIMWC